jgi:hypothetical protein
METKCSSETSVDFQRITRRYNTESRILHNHCCEKFKSYIIQILFWNQELQHCARFCSINLLLLHLGLLTSHVIPHRNTWTCNWTALVRGILLCRTSSPGGLSWTCYLPTWTSEWWIRIQSEKCRYLFANAFLHLFALLCDGNSLP